MAVDKIIDLISLASALFLAVYIRHLIQSFSFMSIGELRRRAEAGNRRAAAILEARGHGLKLWLILWSLFSLTIFFVVRALVYLMPNWWVSAAIAVMTIVSLLFIMPLIRRSEPKLSIAATIAPYLAGFLDRIQFITRLFRPLGLSLWIRPDQPVPIHSKEHLIEIIEDFRMRTKNPRAVADSDLAIATLTFSAKQVSTLMVPLAKIRRVKATQDLTPKLIEQLHDTGFSVFPVQRGDGQDFCGILYLEDLQKLSRTRAVHQIMKPGVRYINAEAPLNQTLDAFFKTKQHLFLVVDRAKEVIGLIDLTDVLRQYVGDQQLTDFKHYDDLDLVARHSLPDKPAGKKKKKVKKKKAVKRKPRP